MSKQTSKWPNTFVLILGCSEPEWVGERERERESERERERDRQTNRDTEKQKLNMRLILFS